MKTCGACGEELPEISRFCTRCGKALTGAGHPEAEEMNMPALYVMVGLLILALLFPPWETAPGQPPEFLGFHLLLSPPEAGVISRLLITIELISIAVAGFYFSWLFRRRF